MAIDDELQAELDQATGHAAPGGTKLTEVWKERWETIRTKVPVGAVIAAIIGAIVIHHFGGAIADPRHHDGAMWFWSFVLSFGIMLGVIALYTPKE